MAPDKQMETGTSRLHLSSLSSLFRFQPRSRPSCIPDSVQEEPTCEEKIHYPVFNPRDPRHNPEISSLSWRRQEPRSSSSEPPTPISWMQTLSRRSYHRARSGLLALRAEFNHRFSEDETPDRGFVNPVALRRAREQHDEASVAYTASTQEDSNFGTEMFRTSNMQTYPTESTETGSLYDILSDSSGAGSAVTVTAFAMKRKLRPRGDAVSTGVKPRYILSHSRDPDFQISGPRELGANGQSNNHLTHITALTDHPLRLSSWGTTFSPSQETEVLRNELTDSHSDGPDGQTTNIQHPSPSLSSSATHVNELLPSSIPLSRQCSAEVRFAFPGIYQEMLEQSARQHDSPCPSVNSSPSSEPYPRLTDHDEPSSNSFRADMDSQFSYYGDDETLPWAISQGSIPHFEEVQAFSHPNPLEFMPSWWFSGDHSSVHERSTACWSSVEEYSSCWINDNGTSRDITSTEMTSLTSMSNDTWSPMDSEVLRSSLEEGNEFLLINGKTSGRPDRNNQTTKAPPHADSNCDVTTRSQESTDLINSRGFALKPQSNGTANVGWSFLEEDTDDEFYPGIA